MLRKIFKKIHIDEFKDTVIAYVHVFGPLVFWIGAIAFGLWFWYSLFTWIF